MNNLILFLDDDINRHEYFLENFKECSSMVWTAVECIDFLNKQSWEIVCLDHDLGGKIFVNSDEEDTGMSVVRWVEQNKPQVELFIIHSWNIPAAQLMHDKLSAAGYNVVRCPFGHKVIDMIKHLRYG